MPITDNEKLLKSIDAKLEQMVRLSALQIASSMRQMQAIQVLNAAGLERKVIADLLNTTPNTVSVTLAKAKAKKSKESEVTEPATTQLEGQP